MSTTIGGVYLIKHSSSFLRIENFHFVFLDARKLRTKGIRNSGMRNNMKELIEVKILTSIKVLEKYLN